MRVLATADLHFNHPRSRELAIDFIGQVNRQQFDVLLVIGDTAHGDGDEIEKCLAMFSFAGAKLFVCGNHELWTRGDDSYHKFTHELPQRVRNAGWHWLEGDPLVIDSVGFVGSVGWYDYSLAPHHLGIPTRFYQAKVSPGAAARLVEHEHLVKDAADVTEQHLEIVARWNDGRYARLHRDDVQFLEELLEGLRRSLEKVRGCRQVIAAVHHLPFAQMLPPRRNATWDFAWAYLGSKAIGELLLQYANVSHLLCGHSHLSMEHQVGHIRAINIGSRYRHKLSVMLELP